MKKNSILLNKWQSISIDVKIGISWAISIVVVISLSAILYISKQELHRSSDVIALNNELRSATQDLLSSIQRLEIVSKQFILTGNKNDSVKYFANLDSLEHNLLRMEGLLKDQPRYQKFFLPLQSTIRNELYKINHLSFSIGSGKSIDWDIVRIEEGIYKKLDNYWKLLDDEEERSTISRIQNLQLRISENLNYFFALIIIYILFLTVLFFIIGTDVNKRRKLAAEVAESRKELSTIINTAPALIFVKNLEKNFTLLNKSFLNFFNVENSEILFKDNSQLVPPGEQWLANEEDEAIINNKISLSNIERQTTLSNGSTRWLNINKAPMFDENDNLVGIVGVMDDITKRIEFQNALMETQKKLEELNKQKDKFFSIVAHDLRSPFTGLLGIAEILSEDYSNLTEEEKRTYIDGIQTSLKSLLSLIDNLLTWARLNLNREEFNPQEISLNQLIRSVFVSQNIAASNKNILLQTDFAKDLKAFADRDMVETVIRNLISNAIKFSNPGGIINVNTFDNGESVLVEVEDNGVGMKAEIVKSLFKINTHTTTKGTNEEKGTGLGLIICKEFIEKNGGTISVSSEPDRGTKISFTLKKVLSSPPENSYSI